MLFFPNEWINTERKVQVLIIGSGAAGLSLALKFEKLNIPSLIVEGGGIELNEKSQEIYKGEIVSKHKLAHGLDGSRLRFLGGSTNCWAGLCGELDEEDFLERDWIKSSGWPILKKDLNAYYDEASIFLDIDRKKIKDPETHAGITSLPGFETRALYSTSIGSFGFSFIDHLKKSNLISVYLDANCTKINTNLNNQYLIDSITIASLEGIKRNIKPTYTILCCGGIENARLLLNTETNSSPAIGNYHNILGKYFSEHPIAPCATVIGPKGKVFNMKQNWHQKNNIMKPYYKVPFEIQKKLKISNSTIHFFEQEDEFSENDLAAIKLYRLLNDNKNLKFDRNDLINLIKNPIDIFKTYFQIKKRKKTRTAVRFQLEQTPNIQSRIYLSNEIDKLGLRKVKLNWVFNEIERKTVDLLMAFTADALQKNRIGTLKMDFQLYKFNQSLPFDLRGGQHHCGTTRMAKTPNKGVVDENLKVFGKSNLFVCGSSVYPTNSWVNPTFTIVALSLRLADHISEIIKKNNSKVIN